MGKKQQSAMAAMLAQLTDKQIDIDSDVQVLGKKNDSSEKDNFLDNIDFYDNLTSEVLEVPTDDCILWEHKDRQKEDLGDLEALAKDIKSNGQVVPGIVRRTNDDKFEIIVGERRWRACVLANVPFKAIVQELSDQDSAIVQAAENLNRKDLSDYSKSLNYNRLIKQKVFSQAELQKRLGISKAQMSNILSFAVIPKELLDLIQDLSALPSSVAASIRSAYKKGYISELKRILPKIKSNTGSKTFEAMLNHELNGTVTSGISEKVFSRDKKHLFTVKTNGNRVTSISIPIDIAENLDEPLFKEKFKELIENMF